MGEPDTGIEQLSTSEINLLLLLESAGTKLYGPDGSVQWALKPEDVCALLELAVELIADWDATTPAAAHARVAWLLGVTTSA